MLKLVDDDQGNYKKFLDDKNKAFFEKTKEQIKNSKGLKTKTEDEIKNLKGDELKEKMDEYFKFIFELNMLQATKTYLDAYVEEKNDGGDSLSKSFEYVKKLKEDANYLKYFSSNLNKLIKIDIDENAGSDYKTLQDDLEKSIETAGVNYESIEKDYNDLLEKSKNENKADEESDDSSDQDETAEDSQQKT